jgi:hypothetical protein
MGGVCSTTDTSGGLDDVDSNAFAEQPTESSSNASAARQSGKVAASNSAEDEDTKPAVGADIKMTESQSKAVREAAHLRATLGQKVGAPCFALPVFPFLNRE